MVCNIKIKKKKKTIVRFKTSLKSAYEYYVLWDYLFQLTYLSVKAPFPSDYNNRIESALSLVWQQFKWFKLDLPSTSNTTGILPDQYLGAPSSKHDDINVCIILFNYYLYNNRAQ